MSNRPVLDRNLDSKAFRDFYYLKEELVNFCRENGIPVSGGNRAFFIEHIGSGFSFNVAFQKWLKNNTGKTYKEAIKCWKYKKQLQGHNRYERADLIAIE